MFLNSHLLTEVEQVCDRIAIVTRGRIVAQGTIAQILGARDAVRIRALDGGVALERVLRPFGTVQRDGDATVVHGIDLANVPALVAALVNARVQVYCVEPLGASLEERFLQLTSERGA